MEKVAIRLMKDVPEQSRPRERLWQYGEKALSDHELLAILLRTGTRSANVMDLAMRILKTFGDFYQLKQASLEELMAIPGIGKIKAVEIKAAIELGSRISKASQIKSGRITTSKKAGEILMKELQGFQQEHVMAIYLNTKNEIIKKETVFIGSLNSSIEDIIYDKKFQKIFTRSLSISIRSINSSIRCSLFCNVSFSQSK